MRNSRNDHLITFSIKDQSHVRKEIGEAPVMKNFLPFMLISLALIFPINQTHAKEDKELHKQRQAAQKVRQVEKNERNQEINDAIKSFQEFTRNLKNEYPALLKDIDTEFELTQVDLQAERAAKVATAEAEYQKKWTSLFMPTGGQMTEETLKKIEEEAKAHSDELFRIKEEAARMAHKEKMASEEQKHALLEQRDSRALAEAHSLGLTKQYEPILATPIGGELTRQEKQWNEREEKDIEKTHARNLQIIREFKNGGKLREWELNNMDKDFQLTWDEKRELHTIESQQMFFNNFLMQSAQGGEINQQEIMTKFAELGKQTKMVKIKYDTMRKKNSITRREEKKKLQEG
jgi:hypothetical protein